MADVYRVDAPFADAVPYAEQHIVQEANPYGVFSHLTAVAYHGLTDLLPDRLYASDFEDARARRLPLGTTPEDWDEVTLPPPRCIRRAERVSVQWTRSKAEWGFGVIVGRCLSLPIYVTDIERTLLDVLRAPDKAGGITGVVETWRRGSEHLDVNRMVSYVDRFDQPILRQRVGYLLEALGRSHSRLDRWREHLVRGGSVKLVASAPYSKIYCERWNLSLNVPDDLLDELREPE